MFSTTRDILNIVLAVCVFSLTVFLCFTLFYLLGALRNIYQVVKELRKGVAKIAETANFLEHKIKAVSDTISELTDNIKGKLNNSGSYLMIIGELLKRMFDFMQDRKEDKETPKSKRK